MARECQRSAKCQGKSPGFLSKWAVDGCQNGIARVSANWTGASKRAYACLELTDQGMGTRPSALLIFNND